MPGSPCPPELWPRVSARLDEALDLPVEVRLRWLDELPEDDRDLRPYLHKLLFAPERRRIGSPRLNGEASAFAQGQTIGGYRLERLLGTGGMGEVWMARRGDGGLQRPVALKLPHAFLLAGTLRARFERERDILAALSHPHIAQLYEAGVDGDHPWLAMEPVDGEPLTTYCRRRRASLDERLDLFAQVLSAVEHAHARFVAHRDLKPSNILVTGAGDVKLLDFGIAKLLGAEGRGEVTELTRLSGAAATPEYAAPEQLAGREVTAASDVYALGVVLYELLAGQRPFAGSPGTSTLRGEPPPLAGRLAPGHAVGGLDARGLRRALAGDLEAIVTKALDPDPERRYRSAAAFADDLERHRRLQPIGARPLSAGARLLRLVRRHRLGAALSTALIVSLVAGVVGIVWQARRAEHEAQRALEQAELANRVSRYLVSLFDTLSPERTGGQPVDPRTLVDTGRKQLDRNLPEGSPLRSRLLGTLGVLYEHLGYNQEAIDALDTALAQGSGRLEPTVEREFWYELGRAHQGLEQRTAARTAFERALALHQGLPEDRDSAQIQAALGLVLLRDGSVTEAISRLQAALALQRRLRDPAGAARSLMFLSEAHTSAGDNGQARAAIDEALALQAAAGGRSDAAYLRILAFKVDQLYFNEETAAAEELAREALDAHRKVFGALSQPTNDLHFRLATILYDQGKVREALDHMREVSRFEQSQGTTSDPSHAQTLDAIGRYELALGELDAAVLDAREANRLWTSSQESRSRFSEIARLNLGRTLTAVRQYAEAAVVLGPELPAQLEGRLADQSRARRCLLLADLSLQQEDLAAAQRWLDCSFKFLPEGGGHKLQQLERDTFAARLLARQGLADAARQQLKPVLATCEADYAPEAPWCLAAALDAVGCADDLHDADWVRELLARVGPEIERTQPPKSPTRRRFDQLQRRWRAGAGA